MLESKVEVNDELKLGLPKKLDTPPYISTFLAICFPSYQLSQLHVLSKPSAFPAVSCLSHVYCPSHLLSQLSVVSAICTIPVVCSQPCALSVVAVELRPHVTASLSSRGFEGVQVFRVMLSFVSLILWELSLREES